jgi:hypothetical protein
MRHSLKLHPDSNSRAIAAITVDVLRPRPQVIELHYVAEGDIDRVRVPPPAPSERRDELWTHTCFEAFLRAPAGGTYHEFNFSPSSQWAAYSFTGYREGMANNRGVKAPHIETHTAADRLDVRVLLEIAPLPRLPDTLPWRLGISAITEETDGAKSYWALAHPQGKPDFHHADSFVLDLPVERT